MRRRRRQENNTPLKNNSIEDLVENEKMNIQFLTLTKQ
jgi:hypothetical protein